jgi:hypothetical protein
MKTMRMARKRASWDRNRDKLELQTRQLIDRELRIRKRAKGWKKLQPGSVADLRQEVEMLKDLRAQLRADHSGRDSRHALRTVQRKIEKKLRQIARIEIQVIEKLNNLA